MQKRTIIKRIRAIITEWGSFGSGEVEGSLGETYSPCVVSMGNLVALAEYFKLNEVDVNVYNPSGFSSDPVDDYTLTYEELPKDVLLEILYIAEAYDVDQHKTQKRISN
jgi:hypothetical protein